MTADSAIITVIVPMYNAEKYIVSLLQSLSEQELSPELFEVIIVDDGSTDSSVELVGKFNAAFHLTVIQQKNAGVSAARNTGAHAARTEYIAFLDNDAIADKSWLKNALQHLENPKFAAIEGRIVARGGSPTVTPYTHVLQNETGGRFMTCNMIFRKSVFDEVGGFDPRFPYFFEDSDLAFSLLERGHSIHFAEDVIVYHPRIQKPFKYHWWQMTGSAFRVPLLFSKHPHIIRNCRYYGIPWRTMTACPIYYYGYYAAALLTLVALISSLSSWQLLKSSALFIYLTSMLGFAFSYSITMYARLRNRTLHWGETWPLLLAYLVIPFVRVFWLLRGARHFQVSYPFP